MRCEAVHTRVAAIELIEAVQAYSTYRTERRMRMKLLMISASAAIALIAATVLRPPPSSTNGMMSLQEIYAEALSERPPTSDRPPK
jgi:hypothetical protein